VLNAERQQLAEGQSLVARMNRVRVHLVSLHIWFWDDSKVCGTKKRDKTAASYFNLCRGDMRGPDLERLRYARLRQSAGSPCRVVACGNGINAARRDDVRAPI
jgi:hypothetical protein